jgi:hypothetical protein
VLNVGVGLSHRSGVIDSVILDHREPLPRVWT